MAGGSRSGSASRSAAKRTSKRATGTHGGKSSARNRQTEPGTKVDDDPYEFYGTQSLQHTACVTPSRFTPRNPRTPQSTGQRMSKPKKSPAERQQEKLHVLEEMELLRAIEESKKQLQVEERRKRLHRRSGCTSNGSVSDKAVDVEEKEDHFAAVESDGEDEIAIKRVCSSDSPSNQDGGKVDRMDEEAVLVSMTRNDEIRLSSKSSTSNEEESKSPSVLDNALGVPHLPVYQSPPQGGQQVRPQDARHEVPVSTSDAHEDCDSASMNTTIMEEEVLEKTFEETSPDATPVLPRLRPTLRDGVLVQVCDDDVRDDPTANVHHCSTPTKTDTSGDDTPPLLKKTRTATFAQSQSQQQSAQQSSSPPRSPSTPPLTPRSDPCHQLSKATRLILEKINACSAQLRIAQEKELQRVAWGKPIRSARWQPMDSLDICQAKTRSSRAARMQESVPMLKLSGVLVEQRDEEADDFVTAATSPPQTLRRSRHVPRVSVTRAAPNSSLVTRSAPSPSPVTRTAPNPSPVTRTARTKTARTRTAKTRTAPSPSPVARTSPSPSPVARTSPSPSPVARTSPSRSPVARTSPSPSPVTRTAPSRSPVTRTAPHTPSGKLDQPNACRRLSLSLKKINANTSIDTTMDGTATTGRCIRGMQVMPVCRERPSKDIEQAETSMANSIPELNTSCQAQLSRNREERDGKEEKMGAENVNKSKPEKEMEEGDEASNMEVENELDEEEEEEEEEEKEEDEEEEEEEEEEEIAEENGQFVNSLYGSQSQHDDDSTAPLYSTHHSSSAGQHPAHTADSEGGSARDTGDVNLMESPRVCLKRRRNRIAVLESSTSEEEEEEEEVEVEEVEEEEEQHDSAELTEQKKLALLNGRSIERRRNSQDGEEEEMAPTRVEIEIDLTSERSPSSAKSTDVATRTTKGRKRLSLSVARNGNSQRQEEEREAREPVQRASPDNCANARQSRHKPPCHEQFVRGVLQQDQDEVEDFTSSSEDSSTWPSLSAIHQPRKRRKRTEREIDKPNQAGSDDDLIIVDDDCDSLSHSRQNGTQEDNEEEEEEEEEEDERNMTTPPLNGAVCHMTTDGGYVVNPEAISNSPIRSYQPINSMSGFDYNNQFSTAAQRKKRQRPAASASRQGESGSSNLQGTRKKKHFFSGRRGRWRGRGRGRQNRGKR